MSCLLAERVHSRGDTSVCVDVVILEHCRVCKVVAVVAAAADRYRVLLERAQSRESLAGIRNAGVGSLHKLDALAEVAREDYEAGILSVEGWEKAYLCPMVDARRMEVYAQVFDADGRPQSEVSAEVIDTESFAAFRGQGRPFVIFGSGARKCADVLPDATLVEVTPSARGLARLAQQALDEGRTVDIAYFEPFYLKDFVVTTSRKKLF